MTLKKYKCEARKRMLVEANSWIEAKGIFEKYLAKNAIDVTIKMYTYTDQIKEYEYQKGYRHARRN